MNQRRLTTVAMASCATLLVAGLFVAPPIGFGLVAFGSADVASAGGERLGAAPIEQRASSRGASDVEVAGAPQAAATANTPVADTPVADTATTNDTGANIVVASADAATAFVAAGATGTMAVLDRPEPVVEAVLPDASQAGPSEPAPVQVATANTPDRPVPDEARPVVTATLPDASQARPSEPPPVQMAMANPTDPVSNDPEPNETSAAVSTIEIVDECLVADACIDQYLWALYQRTLKLDSIKVHERRKVTVRRKGKMVTVTRTFTKRVDDDFTWKDPKAAERSRMSMMDYVIGGMDRSFRLKLFRVLYAAEQAGLSPGITSAFRDDYRQSIASGLKAATGRSFHGGSLRGGYGNGLAADVVSVKGATRAERWVTTEILWKWIDARGKEFGIGRPYLDRDPPHLAPVDGKEWASHHRGTTAQHAESDVKKRNRLTGRNDSRVAKRATSARSSKMRTI